MNRRIDIKVGYRCNNRCQFCVQGDKRSKVPAKSSGQIMMILEQRRRDHDGVVFTGGEATIRPEFLDWVRRARELGYSSIQIQSNGRMFAYDEFCRDAVRAGANEFAVALHGSKSSIHDTLTRVPGSYFQVVRGIKNLKRRKQKIILNTVVNKKNYRDLPDIARLLVSLSVDQFQFAFMHINNIIRMDKLLVDDIVPRKSIVAPYIIKGLQIGIDHKIPVMAEAFPCCFLKGYERYISERFIPYTSVEEDVFVENFARNRREKGKAKGPRCGACVYNNSCEGPWKEYPELFGWDEFIPVKK